MESTSTNRELSDKELRNAGASDLFVAYYNEAGESASARREVEGGPFSLERLNENPSLGGHFFKSLWNGDVETAWSRADGNNRTILRQIGGGPEGL